METDTAAHLSIGEVLSLLTDEFPDVTISKIRFLESQGLIDPERTPSGYRKFYESDIDRLRWVLIQQRDYFLPLKVIKAKLDGGAVDYDDESPAQPNLFDQDPAAPSPETQRPPPEAPASTSENGDAATDGVAAEDDGAADGEDGRDPAAWLAALQEDPTGKTPAPSPRAAVPSRPVESLLDDIGDARYSPDELAAEAGLSIEEVDQLAEFGILMAATAGGQQTYDEAARSVAIAVVPFLRRGIEARHLRAYKLAAEREAGLYEQLVVPLLRQRNPEAKQAAVELVDELTEQGETVRRALLRQAIRSHLGPG